MRLREVTPEDVPTLVDFFAQPHVARWWHQEADPVAVAAEYLSGDSTVYVALVDERPVGMVQTYLWDAESGGYYGIPAGTAGIDYLVGHPIDCDRGTGTAMIAAALELLPAVDVWVTPESANEPSCRVLEKNGFARMAVKQCHVPDEPWAGPTALYKRSAS